ncbi:MAG: deoxyribonuclease IV [Lentisphaeria bacterium]|nr:deoxyribonuclease IV [Lentisphaeria bacterium]
MKYIGAHVSISGGVENAPLNAASIQAKAFAMFTKNQRQWTAPALTQKSIDAFKKNCSEHGFSPDHILPHDGYLINLGNPDEEKRANSRRAFLDEMTRCMALGLRYLNFHPGSHLKQISSQECLLLIASEVKSVLAETENVCAVIENTAGQGSNVGSCFEDLARLIELIGPSDRVGVCLDTCHAFAAGYDLKDRYDQVMDRFGALIGFEFLKGMHLNDSKSVLNGHLDRHHSLGRGELSLETFERIMNDPRLDDKPLILETIDESLWAEEIALLYSMVHS